MCSDLDLMEFSEPDIFNYTTLLLSEKKDALYVGAREAIFELSRKNVTVKNNKVRKYGYDLWQLQKKMQWKYHKNVLHFNHDSLFFFFYHLKVQWKVAENPMTMCTLKGKSKEVS